MSGMPYVTPSPGFFSRRRAVDTPLSRAKRASLSYVRTVMPSRPTSLSPPTGPARR